MHAGRIRADNTLNIGALPVTACTARWQSDFRGRKARKGLSSSLVDRLYPDGRAAPKHTPPGTAPARRPGVCPRRVEQYSWRALDAGVAVRLVQGSMPVIQP